MLNLSRTKEMKQSNFENDNMKKFGNAVFIREGYGTGIR